MTYFYDFITIYDLISCGVCAVIFIYLSPNTNNVDDSLDCNCRQEVTSLRLDSPQPIVDIDVVERVESSISLILNSLPILEIDMDYIIITFGAFIYSHLQSYFFKRSVLITHFIIFQTIRIVMNYMIYRVM